MTLECIQFRLDCLLTKYRHDLDVYFYFLEYFLLRTFYICDVLGKEVFLFCI